MPHFYAKNLESPKYPLKGERFEFLWEARSLRDRSAIILARELSGKKAQIILAKHIKNGRILVKCDKRAKFASRELAKCALREFAALSNAEIISHNLNAHKNEGRAEFLCESIALCEFLRTQNARKSLEIGFGSGRHILNLAKSAPDELFIGLEIYRPAILQVLRQIELLNLKNLFLSHCDSRVFCEILAPKSLQKIYLHFPVPWEKSPNRRVFSAQFLQNAMRALEIGGCLDLRTDSFEYFAYAADLARAYRTESAQNAEEKVVSKYEARWQRQKKNIYSLKIFRDLDLESFESKSNSRDSSLESKFDSLKSLLNSHKNPPQIKRILALKSPKIREKEYFLHIENIYEIDEKTHAILLAFGAYFAPCSGYFVINERAEFLGDFMPSIRNLCALNLLWSV